MEKINSFKLWKQDPSKGEVFTNKKLVNLLLDEIPLHIWKNPKSTFLDMCMGKGTFLIEIVNRLVNIYGYSEENAKSRVFGYDIRVKYVNYLKRRGYKNVFHKDSLVENFKMKFDVVLGNPPYQDYNSQSDAGKLYIEFTKKSNQIVKDDGYICFITPETIVRDGRNKFSIKKINGLKYVNHTTTNHFDVGVNIISWIIDKGYNGLVKVINKDNSIDFRDKNKPLVDIEEIKGVLLFEKLKEQKSKLFVIDQTAKKSTRSDKYIENYFKVIPNINKPNNFFFTPVKPKLYGKRKLIISMSSTFRKNSIHISDNDFGELHVMADIQELNNEQVENLINFLLNPICVNICNKYKKLYKKGFNSMLYLFPKIDFNKKYNDDDVINLFGLNNDEVQYLKT